jgi:hypothetical protein
MLLPRLGRELRDLTPSWSSQPALVLSDLDAVVAWDRFERAEIAAADRAKDGVVGESGAVCDFSRRDNVSGGAAHQLAPARWRNPGQLPAPSSMSLLPEVSVRSAIWSY